MGPDEDVRVIQKRSSILYKGNRVDFPFQKNIHQLPKDEFIECLYDLYYREENNNPSSFEEMLYAKFGRGITEKFLKPYNEKLYACSLESLDADAMGQIFVEENDVLRSEWEQILRDVENDQYLSPTPE